MDPNATIHVNIRNMDGTVLEEDASAISSYNEVGLFDVLPMHANFISIIKDKVIIHHGKEAKEVPIGVGILRVTNNVANIYLGVATEPHEVPQSKQ